MDLTLVLPLLLVLVFGFFMVRRTRQQQKTMIEQQQKMHPGVEVMTSFGLFGRVVSVNPEENKVTLELSAGNNATVHQQAIVKVLESAGPAAAAEDPSITASPGPTPAQGPEGTVAKPTTGPENPNDRQ